MRLHASRLSFQGLDTGSGQFDEPFQEVGYDSLTPACDPQAFPGDMGLRHLPAEAVPFRMANKVTVAAIRLRGVVAAVIDRLFDQEREILHHWFHVIIAQATDGAGRTSKQSPERLSSVGAGPRLGLDER